MTEITSDQKEAFRAAAACLARAFDDYVQETGDEAVLVGGASVTLMAGFRFFSGDFDFVAADDAKLAKHMTANGFVREDRRGNVMFGWYHPDHPLFGFQQVTGPVFGGNSDMHRVLRVDVGQGLILVMPAVEDLIADRLAQHSVSSPTDTSRLDQARAMLEVATEIDHDYLVRRVVQEGGDPRLVEGYGPARKPWEP